MGRNTTWFLLTGVVLAALVTPGGALKGTTIVINKLKGKQADGSPLPAASPVAESRSDVDVEAPSGEGGEAAAANATTKSPLTGIPQIDYVHDPNLPRELNGYNLTDYPFYDRVPEDIDFKCDGLHDGFYASIPHKCQVYHHCLFGTRYDFLCANYTAFDQKTFICHFVSEVDCVNSPKYFKRNEALYKAASTTTVAPSTTQAPPPPPPPIRRPQATATAPGGRRKRPYRRRRPVYDYYYDEDYEDDPDYYEDDLAGQQGGSAAAAPPPPPPRRRRKRPRPQQRPQPVQDYEDQPEPVQEPAVVMPGDSKPRSSSSSVYSRPRVPPKIRRPVPLTEREKYDYKKSAMPLADSAEDTRPAKSHASTAAPPADDYYDDEEEYVPPAKGTQAPAPKPKNPDYYPPSASSDREVGRRPAGRPPRRNRPQAPRRRPADTALPLDDADDDYYESYEQDPPPPPPPRRRPTNGRKRVPASSTRQQEPDPYYRQPTRAQVEDDYPPPRKPAPRGSGRYEDDEDDLPVPAPRPAYISTVPAKSGSVRQVQRKKIPPPEDDYEPYNRRLSSQGSRKQATQRQPPPTSYEDSVEYYDDDVEQPVQTSSRPQPKQQSGYRPRAPATAPPASLPRPSPAPPVRKEVDDEEEIIVPPSRAPSRPFLPSRGGSPTLPRGLQPLGAKAEPKSSSGYRTRIDESQSPTASETLTSKSNKEGEGSKLPTEFRSGGGDISSARPKTQSGGDNLGARTSGKYKSSSARPEPAKNDDLSNAKTSPPLQQKTPLPPIIKNDQPPLPPARTNLADIEDYDVSLNDALHPTLQSTRSVATGIVSFPQLAPSRPQSFRTGSGRGGSPLAAAASQRQITRAPYEPDVGDTYVQPARKRQQQPYGEVDLAPPPVQQRQYRVDGQPLSLGEAEEEQEERLYVSPSRGY